MHPVHAILKLLEEKAGLIYAGLVTLDSQGRDGNRPPSRLGEARLEAGCGGRSRRSGQPPMGGGLLPP